MLLACFMRFIVWKALRSFITEKVELSLSLLLSCSLSRSLSVFLVCRREYTEGFNVITAWMEYSPGSELKPQSSQGEDFLSRLAGEYSMRRSDRSETDERSSLLQGRLWKESRGIPGRKTAERRTYETRASFRIGARRFYRQPGTRTR